MSKVYYGPVVRVASRLTALLLRILTQTHDNPMVTSVCELGLMMAHHNRSKGIEHRAFLKRHDEVAAALETWTEWSGYT